jgi:acyl-CoA thioesterase-1
VKKLGSLLILTVLCGYSFSNGKTNATVYAAGSAIVSATAVSSAAPGADSRPVIVCYGDSLTAGYGVDRNSSYPSVMQRDLDAGGFHYRVVNMGVSGDTTKDGLARIQRVLAARPEVVVVEFGGNDGLRGLPVRETQQNLDSMIAALKKSGTRVTIAGITLPPDYGPDYVGQFNAMFPTVAKKYAVPLLPFIYKDVYGVKGYIQDDGVHATIEGNVQVAKNIEGLIKPLLKK